MCREAAEELAGGASAASDPGLVYLENVPRQRHRIALRAAVAAHIIVCARSGGRSLALAPPAKFSAASRQPSTRALSHRHAHPHRFDVCRRSCFNHRHNRIRFPWQPQANTFLPANVPPICNGDASLFPQEERIEDDMKRSLVTRGILFSLALALLPAAAFASEAFILNIPLRFNANQETGEVRFALDLSAPPAGSQLVVNGNITLNLGDTKPVGPIRSASMPVPAIPSSSSISRSPTSAPTSVPAAVRWRRTSPCASSAPRMSSPTASPPMSSPRRPWSARRPPSAPPTRRPISSRTMTASPPPSMLSTAAACRSTWCSCSTSRGASPTCRPTPSPAPPKCRSSSRPPRPSSPNGSSSTRRPSTVRSGRTTGWRWSSSTMPPSPRPCPAPTLRPTSSSAGAPPTPGRTSSTRSIPSPPAAPPPSAAASTRG